ASGLVMTRGQEHCIAVYPLAEFRQKLEAARRAPTTDTRTRDYLRVLLSGAEDVIPDKQGRITIPGHLRPHADLDRESAVIGALDRLEIWSLPAWATSLEPPVAGRERRGIWQDGTAHRARHRTAAGPAPSQTARQHRPRGGARWTSRTASDPPSTGTCPSSWRPRCGSSPPRCRSPGRSTSTPPSAWAGTPPPSSGPHPTRAWWASTATRRRSNWPVNGCT